MNFHLLLVVVPINLSIIESLREIIDTGKDIIPNVAIERAIIPGKTYCILNIFPKITRRTIGKAIDNMGPNNVFT